MTIEEEEDQPVAASEPTEVTESQAEEQIQDAEPQMVPLSALKATRKKLKDAEAKALMYEEFLKSQQVNKQDQPKEDPNALVEKKDLQAESARTRREVVEEVYQDFFPEHVAQVNKYLDLILEKKPWLSESVHSAKNRWARAYEIVNDYKHLFEKQPAKSATSISEGQRIIQNAQKPRSPAEVGKSAQPRGMEYLKSIQGKKEFREYRQKVLRGEV